MSKEEVPGEKRTTSPGFARACARSTASASECAISHGTAPFQSCADPLRHLADQNRRPHFFGNERPERFESETLVLSAGDQDDRLVLREERFFDRIEIGRLRVIDVIDTANLADEFTAMRPRLVGAKRRNHLRKGQAARQTDGERRHQVLDVVRTAQLRFRQAQDRLVAINDRSAFETEIRLIGVGAEGDRPRRDLRQRLAALTTATSSAV